MANNPLYLNLRGELFVVPRSDVSGVDAVNFNTVINPGRSIGNTTKFGLKLDATGGFSHTEWTSGTDSVDYIHAGGMAASGAFTLEEFSSDNWAMLLFGDAFKTDVDSVSGAFFARKTTITTTVGGKLSQEDKVIMMDGDYPNNATNAIPSVLPKAGEKLPIAESIRAGAKAAKPYLYVMPSSLVIKDSSVTSATVATPGATAATVASTTTVGGVTTIITAGAASTTTTLTPAPKTLVAGTNYKLPDNFAWTGKVEFLKLTDAGGAAYVGPLKCNFAIAGGSATLPAPLVFGQPYALPEQNVSGVLIEDSATPPVKVDASLYDLDAPFGEVTFIDKAAFKAVNPALVEPLKVQYAFGKTEQISIMTNKTIEVSLRFKGVDLVNPGRKLLIEFFRVQLLLPKSLDLLQAQLTSGEQSFNLLPDRTKPEDGVLGRYGRIAVIPV